MAHHAEGMPAEEALARLQAGNAVYVASGAHAGDVGAVRRGELACGQAPFVVIVACSDSRVVPEIIFSCGLGDLFVIRVAGNVMGDCQLGSVEYAVEHLGANLVVVLGHTHCGAVGAALAGGATGCTAAITDEIRAAIGEEADERAASALNAQASAARILRELALDPAPTVLAALYDIESGAVEWL